MNTQQVCAPMFRPINQSEFASALGTLEQIRGTMAMRERLLEQGKLRHELVLPGVMWKIIKLYNYVLNPSYDIVNTWRFHAYPFSGQYLGKMLSCHWAPIPENLNEEYQKLTSRLPKEMVAQPPRMLGEIGWEIDGGLVNEDVLLYQKQITGLYLSGAIDYLRSKGSIRILEIGSGYGGLAYSLWRILKPSLYCLVDLPESLAYSSVYLTLTSGLGGAGGVVYGGDTAALSKPPDRGFVFMPNYLVDDLCKAGKFDLVINAGSFAEMNEEQVSHYARVINDVLADDGIVYEGNAETFVPVISILSKTFKYLSFHKGDRNLRLWARKEEVLSRMKTVEDYRPSVLKTPRAWLQWRLKRTLKKWRQAF
ncbi:MAG: putative sugar O-methyltransferase [Verrucomicrobiia bacterium]